MNMAAARSLLPCACGHAGSSTRSDVFLAKARKNNTRHLHLRTHVPRSTTTASARSPFRTHQPFHVHGKVSTVAHVRVSQTRKLNQRRAAVPTSTSSRSRSRSNTAPPQAAAAGAAATQTAAPSSSLIEQIAKAAWDLFWTLISYMLQPTIIIYVFVTVKLLDKYEKVIKPVYPNQKFNVCFCWPARMLKITEEEFRQNLWNWVKI